MYFIRRVRIDRKIGIGVLLWITCLTAFAAPAPDATGVWYGEIDIAGIRQPFAIALLERADARLIGYVLGGNTSLAIASGQRSRNRIMLELEFVAVAGTETVRIAGRLREDDIAGAARSGHRTSRLRLTRRSADGVAERRFILATVDADGEPETFTNAGLLLSDGGSPGGFYSVPEACGPFGCAGRVSRYDESLDPSGNPVVELDLESGGTCPGSGNVRVVFDPSLQLYTGTYAFSDCGGLRSGPVLGSPLSRTRGDHVLAVLATYARLADDLEQRVTFAPGYPQFAADYLHTSQTLNRRLDELNEQVATYDTIEVELSRFRDLSSIVDPFVFPDVDYGFNIDFRDWRQGQSGSEVEVYRDTTTRAGNDELAFLREQGAEWVIAGNQIRHDLPFAAYTPGVDKVIVPTDGGDVFVSIGPWGAHGPPHTGHLEGNSKADWFAEYAPRRALMTELEGDGNGLCTSGEVCGVPEADLLDRAVSYAAPVDGFKIINVRFRRIDPPGTYYGGDEHWTIRALLGYFTYEFVHVREVAPDLRDAMVAAGYADPWTVHTPPSGNLITGGPIVLDQGQSVAWPQIVATPVPGHPGYFTGGGGLGQTPLQQLEFFNHNNRASREESFYRLLPADLEEQLEGILEAEGLNPLSFRYDSPFLVGLEFLTFAEMALSNQPFTDRSDYSNIFAGLGGWWEDDGDCATAAVCDELFSIFPISRGTVFYDPSLYQSPGVRYLVIHRFPGDVPIQSGEVVQPYEPDPVSGTMVFRWRGQSGEFLGYQAAGYRLDPAGEMLRIRWGAMVPTFELASSTLPPVPGNTDPCDGETLTCHVHRVQ